MKKGHVYLVGAGPGDAGLFTLRGRQVLEKADVVIYDHLLSPQLLDYAPAEAERIYVGKRAADHTLSQEEINRLLVGRAQGGLTVVRLKGGDPFVFGRGGEEALALSEAGIEFEVVPGVTAGVAAPACAGIPVTHRDMASSVVFVTGHEAADRQDSAMDWPALARWQGTIVFYMGVANLQFICRRLLEEGLDADTPAAVIRWGATPRQDVIGGTVSTLPELAQQAGITPPALIIVGKVVELREKLMWLERRPLFGRRAVVTRARQQASELRSSLEDLGAEVIELPTIRIEPPDDPAPLRRAVAELSGFDWIIFTSANGVDAFFAALRAAGLDSRALSENKVCAIGPPTSARLSEHGISPDLQPADYTSQALVEALAAGGELNGARVLCPRANIAPGEMIEALVAQGASVREVIAYRTAPGALDRAKVLKLFEEDGVDWVTFTSSSTVKNFFSAVDVGVTRACHVRLASIGPATSATLRELGLSPDVEAGVHTIPGLVDSIVQYEISRGVRA